MRELALTETISVRVTTDLRRAVEAEARRLRLRPADVVRMALARGLEMQRAGHGANTKKEEG